MINQFLWQDILEEAQRRGIPPAKKRAILREYLQVRFLTNFYRLTGSQNFSFIGGTALRLLHGLDRFSEDLDFDNFGLNAKETKKLFKKPTAEFSREKYQLEFDFRKTKNGGTARLKFPSLLYDLKISQNPKEKLMIKLDFSYQPRLETEVLLLSEFGLSERIVTNSLPVILAQKTKALISRKQIRGRDFYDLYWLLSKKITPNFEILKELKIENINDYFAELKRFYQKEKNNLRKYKNQIRPFLINEENCRYLDFLGEFLTRAGATVELR